MSALVVTLRGEQVATMRAVAAFVAVVALAAGAARADPCRAPVDVVGHGVPANVVNDLRAVAPAFEAEIGDALALESCEPIHVDVLPAIEGASTLEPPWSLPDWAAGAAQPGDRRIVVAVTARGERQDRERILLHELAHVGVHEAGGTRVPRWLDEGTARFLAHESDDPNVLARARIGDRLLPLAALARMFPSDGASANVAYAESSRAASIIADAKPGGLGRVLHAIRDAPREAADVDVVDDAVLGVTGRRVWQLDNDVAASIPLGRAWAIVGLNSDLAYGLAALVTAWAGIRARRQIRRRMRALDDADTLASWWRLSGEAVGLRRWTVQS